jgi:hypothetical protein
MTIHKSLREKMKKVDYDDTIFPDAAAASHQPKGG